MYPFVIYIRNWANHLIALPMFSPFCTSSAIIAITHINARNRFNDASVAHASVLFTHEDAAKRRP